MNTRTSRTRTDTRNPASGMPPYQLGNRPSYIFRITQLTGGVKCAGKTRACRSLMEPLQLPG